MNVSRVCVRTVVMWSQLPVSRSNSGDLDGDVLQQELLGWGGTFFIGNLLIIKICKKGKIGKPF